MTEATEMITITSRCLCGQITVMTNLPSSEIPVTTQLCACHTCRHVSGALAIISVDTHRAAKIEGEIARYATSNGFRGLWRCFCPKCGCTLLEESQDPTRIGLSGGAIENASEVIKLRAHIFTFTTQDGGMRDWLPDIPSHELDLESARMGNFYDRTRLGRPAKFSPDERLHCTCECEGVQFDVLRPAEAQPTDEKADPEWEKWWIAAEGTKYAAQLCVCKECRLSSGYDIQPWAMVPASRIVLPSGETLEACKERTGSLLFGTLRKYASSDRAERYFCGKCSAVVFFQPHSRPHLVNVSVGLLEAMSGSRAEDWLEWMDWISFRKDAANRPLFEQLERGYATWREKTGRSRMAIRNPVDRRGENTL